MTDYICRFCGEEFQSGTAWNIHEEAHRKAKEIIAKEWGRFAKVGLILCLLSYPACGQEIQPYRNPLVWSMSEGYINTDLEHLKFRDGKAIFDIPIEAPNGFKLEGNPYGPDPVGTSPINLQSLKALAFLVMKEQLSSGPIFVKEETRMVQEHRSVIERRVQFEGHHENYILFDWTAIWSLFTGIALWRLGNAIYQTYLFGYMLAEKQSKEASNSALPK